MKSLIKVLTVVLLLNVGTSLITQKASAQVAVSFQLFYDNLSPYGSWVDNPSYGYVWIPSVGAGFFPYATAGHWVFTPYGWTWVSDYPWGWAPFHYGRWYLDPIYGWIWVPADEWGPAWVAWCGAPGYYGWAPLEPGWDVNLVVAGHYRIPPERWVFVPDQDIDRPDIEHYYGPRTENAKIASNTTIINKTYVDNSTHAKYISGPDKSDVEKRTGKQIQPVQVKQMDKPGQKLNGNELAIYRPQVQKTAPNGEKSAPKKVVPMKEVKPVNERAAEKQQAYPPNNTEHKETPANKNQQPKQEAPKNVTPENRNPKENPAPPHENAPVNDRNQQQQQEPQPPREQNQPNTNERQNQTPPREEAPPKTNDDPQQQPAEEHKDVNQDEHQQPSAPDNQEEVKQDQQQPQQQPAPEPQTHKKKKTKPK